MIKENSILSFRNSRCCLNPHYSKLCVTLNVQLLIWTICHIDLESLRLDFYKIKIKSQKLDLLKKKHFILIDIEYQKLDIFLKFAQNSSLIDSSSTGENFYKHRISLHSPHCLSPIILSLTNSLPHHIASHSHSPHCHSLSLTTLPLSLLFPLNTFISQVRVF